MSTGNRDLLNAEITRGPNQGRLVLTLDGAVLGERSDLTGALNTLCAESHKRDRVIAVRVSAGSGVRYYSITPGGDITRASAPAPTSATPVLTVNGSRDLGASPTRQADAERWVEDTILDVDPCEETAELAEIIPAPSGASRGWFSRFVGR